MSKSKGKTWEEIYGIEAAQKRRDKMIKNNPFNSLSKDKKEEIISKMKAGLSKNTINGMKGRKHSEESKRKMSETKKMKYKENPSYFDKVKQVSINRVSKIQKIKITCQQCKKEMLLYPSQYKYKKNRVKKFCSSKCHRAYIIEHPHFNYKPNSWEKRIINLQILGLEFVGDHKFWISMYKENGSKFNKNPDFIYRPFSINKMVIEVWGKRWHTKEEMQYIKSEYNRLGINCLLLDENNFKSKSKLFNTIWEWIKSYARKISISSKINKKDISKSESLRHNYEESHFDL